MRTLMATAKPNNYLAAELIFNILSWLPVASLLRFKSVCMLWLSIISSPRFVETHNLNSKKKRPCILKVITYQYSSHVSMHMDYVLRYRDVVYMDNIDDSVMIRFVDSVMIRFVDSVMINLPQDRRTTRFVGSYNGLVCLVIAETLYLWNPSTKLFKILPNPEKKSERRLLDDLGFGFDSTSNDYKILKIVYGAGYFSGLEAELYSANADSWKEIEVPKTLKNFQISPTSKCVHAQTGALYYSGINELVSFNLHNELFKVYAYPPCSQKDERKSDVLDFEGSVAMAFQSCHDGSVSLWTLDDVCGKVSWTKKFNLEDNLKIGRVVLYLGVGQCVVAEDNVWRSGYILYDHKSKETKKIPLPFPISEVTSLVKYTESLVSLEGFVQQTRRRKLGKRKQTMPLFVDGPRA